MMRRRQAQALVEYALILALISVVAIAALRLAGTNVNLIYSNVQERLAVVCPGGGAGPGNGAGCGLGVPKGGGGVPKGGGGGG